MFTTILWVKEYILYLNKIYKKRNYYYYRIAE